MSSNYLENSSKFVQRPMDRFLMLLKTRGPQTSGEAGKTLGITDEAARQQFVKLAREGVVEAVSVPAGVGRPTQVWRLTSAGHARFPDAHSDLTVQLLNNIRMELGEEALDRLISARERETRAGYLAEMADATTLEERVARLAEIRSREGYMAEWKREGDDFVLAENHCPICAAATTCQGFCRAELSVFQEILGDEVKVIRLEHIPAGARRCAYRVTPCPKAVVGGP